ncbi:MAG: dUTP diphosphatase [Hyphomicrobiaceae bacterium]|nr:dUTP diphosphatase [Hyphomicrobiaceae bacterium]
MTTSRKPRANARANAGTGNRRATSTAFGAGGEAGRIDVAVFRLPHGAGLPLPAYQTAAAAGLDLLAAVPEAEPLILRPGARQLVPTGLVLMLPEGSEAQVRPRSGLALKHGVTVLNSPGTIDADYRGEVMVLLVNFGETAFEINRGERVAQLVVAPVAQARLIEVDEATTSQRGKGGFGSTGLKALGLASKSKREPANSGERGSQRPQGKQISESAIRTKQPSRRAVSKAAKSSDRG